MSAASNRGSSFRARWLLYMGDMLAISLAVCGVLLLIGVVALPIFLLGPWGLIISVPLLPIGLATLVAAVPGG